MAKRRSGSLAGVSVADLRREIARRQRSVGTLLRKRDRLMEKVRALDAQISELGGTVRGADGIVGARQRPKNDSNLVEALVKLLDGKTMNVTDIAQKVQEAGYQTTSENFRTIVNQTLINSGKFKRVARGQYTAK